MKKRCTDRFALTANHEVKCHHAERKTADCRADSRRRDDLVLVNRTGHRYLLDAGVF